MQRGERVFALLLGVFGAVWIWQSLDLTYLSHYAPGSGFLPRWLGGILIALAALFLWTERRTPAPEPQPSNPRRLWSIVGGLALTVVLVEPLGFSVPVAAYLLFLLRRLEGLPWRTSLLLAAGVSIGIYAVFKLWLGVPLPRGPWGF